MNQRIASTSRYVASNDVMPVKSVIIPPSIKQRVRVGDADAAISSFNESGFQELAYDAARMTLIQSGANCQSTLPNRFGGFDEQPACYARPPRSECALRPSGSSEQVGVTQVLIEYPGSDDSRVSREVQPGKFGLNATFSRGVSHVRNCQDRDRFIWEALLGHFKLVNCGSDMANGA